MPSDSGAPSTAYVIYVIEFSVADTSEMPDEVKKKEVKKSKASSAPENKKDAAKPKTVKLKKRPKRTYGRLYAKAVFTGFRRGLRNQHENTSLLKVDGCLTKSDSLFYVGKKCVFVYRVSILFISIESCPYSCCS